LPDAALSPYNFNVLKPLKRLIEFKRYVSPRINPWAKTKPQRGENTSAMGAAHRTEKQIVTSREAA
jgi:hypothetical protein